MIRFMAAALLAWAALAQDPSPRERALQARLVAACCWNEPISHHRSETSLEMRVELSRLLDEGKTDREVLDWFVAKYGARVLIEPEGTSSLVAYALPAVVIAMGFILVALLLRRWTRQRA